MEKVSIFHIGQRDLDLRHRRKESSVIMWNTQTLEISAKFLGLTNFVFSQIKNLTLTGKP